MENNEQIGLDEKSIILNKILGAGLVGLGIYGLYMALKIYKQG